MTVYEGMKGLLENAFINVKNRSFVITANWRFRRAAPRAWSSPRAGKWAAGAYLKEGKPRFAYNWLARETYKTAGGTRLPAGPVTLRFEFFYDGGKPGAGGRVFFRRR